MRQYLEIKRRHEDAILFFRLGDFYEMFFEDAERASSLLDIALTSRNRNDEHPIPMCGVPYHSARGYIAKLLEAGVKVAICEQMELPRRGIARREVTRVITPGTTLDEDALAPDRANFLACVSAGQSFWALAWADFSTGEVAVTEVDGPEAVEEELARLAPSELLLDPDIDERLAERLVRAAGSSLVSRCGAPAGGVGEARLEPPAEAGDSARAAIAGLDSYLAATHPAARDHLRAPEYLHSRRFVRIDRATCRNLELVESSRGKRKGSLLAVLDEAVTPMGKRRLRQWLLRPLAGADAIGARLDAVEYLVEDAALRMEVRERLRAVGDLERLGGRIGARSATPRDLGRLVQALRGVGEVAGLLSGRDLGALLERAARDLDSLPELADELSRALVDEPPAALGRGPVIRAGYHEEVDRLRAISSGGKDWMAEFESAERHRTGIGNLKIGYNKVFGYFIEVSRAAHDRVPPEYERKQTLANAERYITPDLKQREAEVLGAEERLAVLERHLFDGLVERCAGHLDAMARTAAALATIDVVAGLAETAHRRGYVRPELVRGGGLCIEEGRHPVVESVLGQRFVPNDCRLGGDGPSLLVITGPNMAGKSTYLRQVALIVLLAHCGSFVPAAAARIPLVDRIFTRIGASDDLVAGQSTFMVEMTETAAILRNMTEKSLVVLDEIGRGTSTFDGVSIAWAVAEAMVAARVKTLFATHYHELAALADEHEAVANFSVAVRRYRGEIIFLYRVVEGATSGSYGIEVARLAGVPEDVIESARRMLAKFERGEHLQADSLRQVQPGLFDPPPVREDPIRRRIAQIEVETLTPLDALNVLAELVGEARGGQ
ncbi:MAG: DNA mismatch repair protein MutS [Deltaproteobacteria bacterium]|nr:MAG: DNA mismatch repair protein MutS [Deltaproteobacteria bacterium]